MSPGPWLVVALIRLYPKTFRERFGEEMLATYLDVRDATRARRPGAPRSSLGHTAATLVDLLVSLPAVRHAERRRSASAPDVRSNPMRRFASDLRHVVRGLRKQPGFAAVAVLTLALGIGANTAVFSVLNSVVLAPLPYDEPAQLVRIYTGSRQSSDAGGWLTRGDIYDLREERDAFASVGVFYTYRETGADLSGADGSPRRVRVLPVNGDYFRTLRASPILGRTFAAEEERSGVTRIVLSHRLWRDLTGGDRSVVGRTIDLNGQAYEVIGVMRDGFRDLAGDDVMAWVPIDLEPRGQNDRQNHFLAATARLAPGVTVEQARARIDAMMVRHAAEYDDAGRIIRAFPLLDDVVGASRGALIVLMGAAGLVLLIACLNVANLFLVRSLGQTRDLAVRTALGANRSRLVSERLAESVVVALVGGTVGSVVAFWGVKLLLAVSPESLARAEEVGFDPRLLGFALVTTVATGLLFGAWPAWRASRVDPTEALHEGARGNTGGRGNRRARDLLVAGQVAIAVVLLIGAGTLIRSFLMLQQTSLGFVPDLVATFEVNLPPARYAEPAERVRFQEAFVERLRQLAGVERAGAVSWLPADGSFHKWGVRVRDPEGEERWVSAQMRVIEGDYFETLRIPLVAGRGFTVADGLDSAGVVVVSRRFAQEAFGDRDPLGESVSILGNVQARIIGVVGDVAYEAGGAMAPALYATHRFYAGDRNWTLAYVVRTATDSRTAIERARVALAEVDPALVLFKPRTLDDVVARHRARDRFTLLLLSVFAGVALTLAAVGLYGVLSYAVTQQSHEIGVRMALGAPPGRVRAAVMRHGAAIALAGMGVGFVAAFGLSRVIESAVFGARGSDPLVFGLVLAMLGLVVLAAVYLPARRATRIDPLDALRSE